MSKLSYATLSYGGKLSDHLSNAWDLLVTQKSRIASTTGTGWVVLCCYTRRWTTGGMTALVVYDVVPSWLAARGPQRGRPNGLGHRSCPKPLMRLHGSGTRNLGISDAATRRRMCLPGPNQLHTGYLHSRVHWPLNLILSHGGKHTLGSAGANRVSIAARPHTTLAHLPRVLDHSSTGWVEADSSWSPV